MTLLLPGQSSHIVDEARRQRALDDTGALAVTALAAKGSLTAPHVLHDISDLDRYLGPQVPWSSLHPFARAFFDRGGQTLLVQRYDGDDAAAAKVELSGGGRFFAASPGAEGDLLAIHIESALTGTARIIHVFRENTNGDPVEVLRSPPLRNLSAIAAWAMGDQVAAYITWDAEDLTALPAATSGSTPVALTGGAEDHANAGDAERAAALGILAQAPGVGQLAAVDGGSDQARADLLAASLLCNRHALLDCEPDASPEDAIAAHTALPPSDALRYCQLFFQHALVQQLGALQQVPASAIVAAKLAAVDRAPGLGPHVPAAGRQGLLDIDGLTRTVTESERALLNDAQVNVIKDFGGGIYRNYAWWSQADRDTDQGWVQSTAHREVMRIGALADPVMENFVGVDIDPDSTASLTGELAGLMDEEQRRGAFNRPGEANAYTLDVGSDTATPEDARWTAAATFVPVRAAVRVDFTLTNALKGV